VDVDLVSVPKCLDEVESFSCDPAFGESPRLTLRGKKGKCEGVVEIYFEPFEGDEPQTVLDVNRGAWGKKRAADE